MEYKHLTRFCADAKVLDADEKLKKEAFASLVELQALMPKDFNPQSEPDLLYIASPLVLVGKCNLNGDCLDKKSAIANYKTFAKKLLDVEHKRDNIVGNIFAVALTEVDTNRILTDEEAMQKDLFNISYAAYIWRVANPKLSEFISMASNEKSPYFNNVSSSFEVGFDEYKIAVGNSTLSEAKILSTEEAVAYEGFLKANGGKGVDDDGNFVYRVLAYDWSGRGAGLVARPASQVKGVLTIEKMMETVAELEEEDEEEEDKKSKKAEKGDKFKKFKKIKKGDKKDGEKEDDEEEDEEDDEEDEDEVSAQTAAAQLIKALNNLAKTVDKNDVIQKMMGVLVPTPSENTLPTEDKKEVTANDSNNLEKNNIQSKNDGVITNTANPMKITKLEDIAANKAELFKNEAYATDIAQLIADETAKISERYVAKLKESEDAAKFLGEAKTSAEAKAKELEAKSAELEVKIQELAAQLNKIEEAKAAEIAEKLFQERMSGLDAEFDLDEESRAFVAADLKGMNDEAFATYAKKAKALFKKKAAVAALEKKEEKVELDAKAAVAEAVKDEKQTVMTNTIVASETLADRMKKAFNTDNVKVNGKEIKASKQE